MNKEDLNRIKAIKNGNVKEFEMFFRELYLPLKAYARKILEDEMEAEEVVQNLFYNYWKNRQRIEINSSLSSYMFRAVHNNCLQVIRQGKLKYKYEKYIKSQSIESIEPLEELKYQELNGKINRLLGELPERCQEIFKLSRFQGLKYQEIADKLSISIKTVEANMTKALKHFRKNLEEYMINS